MYDPVKHICLKGTTMVAIYIEVEHDETKVVHVAGPLYVVYPHNVTLGPYKCCEHKHEGMAESAHSIDGTMAEATVDGTYPFVITSKSAHKSKGAENMRSAIDVSVHVVHEGYELTDLCHTTEDGARKTVDYLVSVGSPVITDAPACITAKKVNTFPEDVACTVLEIFVCPTGASD